MNPDLLKTIETELDYLIAQNRLSEKYTVIFGMNHPGDFIIKTLRQKGITAQAVIDNNPGNKGLVLEGVIVTQPGDALSVFRDDAAVLICSRYYTEMCNQLTRMGYQSGVHIFKLLDMGGGAEPSLAETVFNEKAGQALKGALLAEKLFSDLRAEHLFVCPVRANGDVYMACSFLNAYCRQNDFQNAALVVIGAACRQVAGLFGFENVYQAGQDEINALTAAYSMTDRYTNLHILQPFWNAASFINRLDCYKGLHFCDYYQYWVFGLDEGTEPEKPISQAVETFVSDLFAQNGLKKGRTVIMSPYANSLQAIPMSVFERLAAVLSQKGYHVATNTAGAETAVTGTISLQFPIRHLMAVAGHAGAYVGIRNGLSEIISTVPCKKVILYPQKAYGFGTALDLYSIRHIGAAMPVLELIYDGNTQKMIETVVGMLAE